MSQEPDLREKCLCVLVSREDVQREFPSAPAPSAPDLKAILSEAIRMKPNLGQREAFKIARDAGAKEPREKILDFLKTLGGASKRGPKGPRKNCATPPAQCGAIAYFDKRIFWYLTGSHLTRRWLYEYR